MGGASFVRIFLLILASGFGGVAVWMLHPVCTPIPDAALAEFDPPIEARSERGMLFRTFQKRDGHWEHCKARLERWGFS